MMIVVALSTTGEHDYVWAASFVGAGLLAWLLLLRWRSLPTVGDCRLRLPPASNSDPPAAASPPASDRAPRR
jgi:hypothetical protein